MRLLGAAAGLVVAYVLSALFVLIVHPGGTVAFLVGVALGFACTATGAAWGARR